MGRPDINTKFISAETTVSIPIIWLSAQYFGTMLTVVMTVFILVLISAVIRLAIVAIILDIRVIEYYSIFRTPFAASAVMFGAVSALRWTIEGWPDGIVLFTLVVFGAFTYISAVWLLDGLAVKAVITTFGTRTGKRPSKTEQDGDA